MKLFGCTFTATAHRLQSVALLLQQSLKPRRSGHPRLECCALLDRQRTVSECGKLGELAF
jgi:hypothetical protein